MAVVLIILHGVSYQEAQKQAASDIKNLNLALESQLNASFIEQLQVALEGLTASVPGRELIDDKAYQTDSAVLQIIRQHPSMSFLVTDREWRVKLRSGPLSDSNLYSSNTARSTLADDRGGCQTTLVFYGVVGASDGVLSASMPLMDKQGLVAGRVSANLPLDLIKNSWTSSM